MADEHDDGDNNAEEFDTLTEVRAALEAVERRQGDAARQRRRLQIQLDGLLQALREDALVFWFDADGEVVDVKGPLDEQLGISAAELLGKLEEFADEETVDALEEANRTVLEDDAAGACVSDGFLRGSEEDIAVTFIHLRRTDEDGETLGTEVIGLVAPVAEPDEDLDTGLDPFEDLLGRTARRLLDDAGEASIARAVQTLGDFLLADRVVVNHYDEQKRRFSAEVSWLRGDARPLDAEARGISISELPWAYSALSAGEALVISADADLPADARSEKGLYASGDVASALLVPMVRGDALTGFVSIQSLSDERRWQEADIARARGLVMLLAATLARAEVEAELEKVGHEADQAKATAEKAETRVEQADARAAEARQERDELAEEVAALRSRVDRLEADVEKARDGEKQAIADAERAKAELETAQQEAEEARGRLDGVTDDAETTRSEVERLKADAERAQRRSEDAAADALAVRKELEEVREQLAEALRDAAELRAGGAAAGETRRGGTFGAAGADVPVVELDEDEDDEVGGSDEPDILAEDVTADDAAATTDDDEPAWGGAADDTAEERGRPWKRSVDGGFDPDATLEMKTGDLGRRFDPDATVEMEALNPDLDTAGAGDDGKTDDVDAEVDLPPAVGLDDLLQHTQSSSTEEDGPEQWKDDKVSWEDRTGEVDLPEFLGGADRRDRIESVDAGAASAGGREQQEDVADDVEAARQLAREVAGKDEEHRASDLEAGPLPVILPDQVERTGELDAYAPRDATTDESAEAGAATEEDPMIALRRLSGVDVEVGLEDVGGNVELYRNLLTKFRNDYIGAAAKIDGAIGKGNIEVAHLLLHAVKGVAGVLGARRVRDTADELETKLIGSDPAETRAAAEGFTEALNEVLDGIAQLAGETADASPTRRESGDADEAGGVADPPAEAHVSDPMVLRSYLSGLRQHLLAEKARQCQLVMREITARNWPGDYNQRVAELAGLVDAADFEQARTVFDNLMGQFDGD